MADDIYAKVTKLDRRLGKLERRPMASSSGASGGGGGDVTQADLAEALLTSATYANEQDAVVLLNAATYTNEQIAALEFEAGAGWDATTVTLDFSSDEGLTGPYVLTQPDGVSANVASIASGRQRFTAGGSNDGNFREVYGIPGTGVLADSEVRATWPATSIDLASTSLWQPGNAHRLTYDRIDATDGTASAGGASTITDTSQAWATNEWIGEYRYYVTITAGTGAGQTRHIVSNTGTQLTVNAAWITNPDATSVYEVWRWRTRALVWAPNVAFGAHGIINFYTWDDFTYDTIDGFDAQDYLGNAGGPFASLPWKIKSRVVGNVAECAVWVEGDPEPDYGTPGQSGRFAIPDGWGKPGECGLYVGHIPASGWLEIDDVTVTGRPAAPEEHNLQVVGWDDTEGFEGLHIDASLGDYVLAIVGSPGGAVFPPTNPTPGQFLTVQIVQGPTPYGVIFDATFEDAPIPDTTAGSSTTATWRYNGLTWTRVGGGGGGGTGSLDFYTFSQPGDTLIPFVSMPYHTRRAGEFSSFEVWLDDNYTTTSNTVVRLLLNGSPVAGSTVTLSAGEYREQVAISGAVSANDSLRAEILSVGTGAQGLGAEARVNTPDASGPQGPPGDPAQGVAPGSPTPIALTTMPGTFDSRAQHTTAHTIGVGYGSNEHYAIWWQGWNSAGAAGDSFFPVIGKRILGANGTTSSRWERAVIRDLVFHNTIGVAHNDIHNQLNIAISTDNRLHVMGAVHLAPMKYVRTELPLDEYPTLEDITWVAPGMIGPNPWPNEGEPDWSDDVVADTPLASLPYPGGASHGYWLTDYRQLLRNVNGVPGTGPVKAAQEDYTTYPLIFTDSQGRLYVIYRHGASGFGSWIMNTWNAATLTWERIGDPYFLEGVGTQGVAPHYDPDDLDLIEVLDGDEQLYPAYPTFDDNDRLVIFGITRQAVRDVLSSPQPNGVIGGNLVGYERDISFAWIDNLDTIPRAVRADGTIISSNLITNPLTAQDMEAPVQFLSENAFDNSLGAADVDDLGRPHCCVKWNTRVSTLTATGATSGTFTLTLALGAQETASLDYNATRADIAAALGALAFVGEESVKVTGGPVNERPVVIEFTGPLTKLQDSYLALTVTDNAVVGATPTVTFTVRTNYWHLWYDGTEWHFDPTTDLTTPYRFVGYTRNQSAATVVCHLDRTYAVFRAFVDGLRNHIWMVDMTDSANEPGRCPVFPIIGADFSSWDPWPNPRARRERGEFHVYVSPFFSQGSITPLAPFYGSETNWQRQWGGMLSIDLDSIGLLQSRAVVVPQLKTVSSITPPGFTTLTPGSSAVGSLTLPVTADMAGKAVFVKMHGRSVVPGGGVLTADCAAYYTPIDETTGNVTQFGTTIGQMTVNAAFGARDVSWSTGWLFYSIVPSDGEPWDELSGFIQIRSSYSGGSSNAFLSAQRLDIAIFEPDPL